MTTDSRRAGSSRIASRLAAVALLVLVAAGCDSRYGVIQRDTPWVNIPIGTISGSESGAFGIDAFIGIYAPCQDNRADNAYGFTQDIYYGACALPSVNDRPVYISYTEYIRWTGNNTNRFGIFLDNSGPCNDTSGTFCSKGDVLQHDWAKKWTRFAIELYPDQPGMAGVRFEVPCCPGMANGGAYTPNVGNVALPQAGMSGTSPFLVRVDGVAAVNEVGVDVFQVDEEPSATSSGGIPLSSFASGHNGKDGDPVDRYELDALYAGRYAVYLTDRAHPSRSVVAQLRLPQQSTLDIDLDAPCFGVAEPYKPATWYNNDRLTPQDCAALWNA